LLLDKIEKLKKITSDKFQVIHSDYKYCEYTCFILASLNCLKPKLKCIGGDA